MLDPEREEEPSPCLGCPLVALDDYLHTSMGQRILNALDLEFALKNGFTVTLDDISYREFTILKIVVAERLRWEREQQEAEIEKQKRLHGH